MSASLVSIIGPPAVGKTTLAEFLCEDLPAEIIREDYAGNPFLVDSYVGQQRWCLPAQLYFLLGRVSQLSASSWPPGGLFVSDYGYCQDRIYARERLARADFSAYCAVADRFDGLVHAPDVIIHLDAPEELLLERIAARGRDFEQVMDAGFLGRMRARYARYASGCNCPVVAADCGSVDFRSRERREDLVARVRRRLGEIKTSANTEA